MDITSVSLPAQPYLYVACECAMDGPAIAAAMGAGFGAVYSFIAAQGITPESAPMAVYWTMPEGGRMAFHCGFQVSAADAATASGPVEAGALPNESALHTTHVGPYDRLNQTHGAVWKHAEDQGLTTTMPVWEIYIDDPGETAEETLRTLVYHTLS